MGFKQGLSLLCFVHWSKESEMYELYLVGVLVYLISGLQIMPKSVKFIQHEVNILLSLGLVGDDGPEEVWKRSQRLVADHHGASLHHATLIN